MSTIQVQKSSYTSFSAERCSRHLAHYAFVIRRGNIHEYKVPSPDNGKKQPGLTMETLEDIDCPFGMWGISFSWSCTGPDAPYLSNDKYYKSVSHTHHY
jgi:hypothetical protein